MEVLDSLSDFLHENPQRSFTIVLAVMLLVYYIRTVAKVPLLACRNGKFSSFLAQHCPVLQQKYWPTIWCFESRLQTVFASVLRTSIPQLQYKREAISLSDGGEVSLDWMESTAPFEGEEEFRPTIILLPGLTGDSNSNYLRTLVQQARKTGYRSVVFNNRGRGGIQLKTPRTYSAANFDDLHEVVCHINKKYPSSPLYAAGISLGGIILGNYLCNVGKDIKLRAAMLISVVYNIPDGCRSLEQPVLNLMLNRHLANSLKASVKAYTAMFGKKIDMDVVLRSRTVREFDASYTSKMFGYEDVDAYYDAASLYTRLHNIAIPTLCLSAADDPFQPAASLPIESAKLSSNVAMVVTTRGGHIGFLEGFLPIGTTFLDRLFTEYITALLHHSDQLCHQGEGDVAD